MNEPITALSITADGYLSAACTLAIFTVTMLIRYRSAWRNRVDKKLAELQTHAEQQNEHLTRHDRKFQTLRDKHGLDTTLTD